MTYEIFAYESQGLRSTTHASIRRKLSSSQFKLTTHNNTRPKFEKCQLPFYEFCITLLEPESEWCIAGILVILDQSVMSQLNST